MMRPTALVRVVLHAGSGAMSTASAVEVRRSRFKAFLANWRWNSDAGAAILLGVAALGTAWSSYQASVWGGIQASNYTRSSVLRGQASEASDAVARARALDVALFTKWLEAKVDHRPRLAAMYEAHFRSELRKAFDAWRAVVGNNEATTTTPFDRPEYRAAHADEAERLQQQSMRALETGERANHISDIYFFVTVIFATVLFFGGALRPLVPPRFKNVVTFLATLLCIWAVTQLLKAPAAR